MRSKFVHRHKTSVLWIDKYRYLNFLEQIAECSSLTSVTVCGPYTKVAPIALCLCRP